MKLTFYDIIAEVTAAQRFIVSALLVAQRNVTKRAAASLFVRFAMSALCGDLNRSTQHWGPAGNK
jgi:hypothetical protein